MITNRQNDDEIIGTCPICDRGMVAGISSDEHHWIPKAKGGRKGKKSLVHRICHSKIHSLWSERELAKTYNNPEIIKAAPEMQEFLNWTKGKRPDFYVPTKMHNRRRR